MRFESAVFHRPSDEFEPKTPRPNRIARSGDVGKIRLFKNPDSLGFWVFDVAAKGGAPVTGPHADKIRAGIASVVKRHQVKPPHAIVMSVNDFLEKTKSEMAERMEKPSFSKKLGGQEKELDSLKSYYKNLFATGIAGVIKGRVLQYCNAGHEPLLVVRRGRVIELTDENHSGAIAMFEGTKFGLSKFELKDGDLLVAHTDGVTDHRKVGHADCFGSFNLHNLLLENARLPPKQLVKALKTALEKHSEFFQDDATLLAIKANPKGY